MARLCPLTYPRYAAIPALDLTDSAMPDAPSLSSPQRKSEYEHLCNHFPLLIRYHFPSDKADAEIERVSRELEEFEESDLEGRITFLENQCDTIPLRAQYLKFRAECKELREQLKARSLPEARIPHIPGPENARGRPQKIHDLIWDLRNYLANNGTRSSFGLGR